MDDPQARLSYTFGAAELVAAMLTEIKLLNILRPQSARAKYNTFFKQTLLVAVL